MTAKAPRSGGRGLPGRRRRSATGDHLEAVLDQTDAAFDRSIDAIRANHPDYTDEQVRLAAIRLRLGDEVFSRAHPGAPRLDP